MGRTYRTPSPTKEAYISTSNVNSPYAPPEARHASYQQPAIKTEEQHQRDDAALARLRSDLDVNSDSVDPKPFNKTAPVNSEGAEGIAQPDEPQTPKKKRTPILWHGLPSPDTPTFHGDAGTTTSAADSTRTELTDRGGIDNVKITISPAFGITTQNDDELARELAQTLSPSLTRRSTRLRKQPKPIYTVQVPVTAPRTLRKLLPATKASDPAAQPEFSFSTEPIKADPVPFDGLPTVHSLSWQLQYPPGGSTHPCYPYPALDPRLLFHQAFVPIIGGLPDFKLVPKLVLPMGWKQVSWSGLLPIVFDPYRQAFKLTPVGPMPLTCEELHQQGLHKYVPGGELHPEYGMLPDMLKLSDGSDAEVFNFDGTDWTLPWDGQLDFHAPSSETITRRESESYSTPSSPLVFTPVAPTHYNEAWDCPDGIIDLSDAWRWLAEYDIKPTSSFIASSGKTWRGTGSHRVPRRYKQPIASLMSNTIATLVSNPTETFLVNQDTREFCTFRSVATPVHVNITLLEDMEFTLKELLCYFPWHYYWRKAADRFVAAGLSGGDVANMINLTRKLEGDAARKSGGITGNILYETAEDGTRVKIVRSGDGKPRYTAQGWTYDQWELADYPLLGLAHGLVELPTGEDAGPLTKMIIWCREQGKYRTMLSEVPALLEEAGIEEKIQRPEIGCPDQMMFFDHAEVVKEDRKRVIASEKLLKRKREHEGREETRGRKRKSE
ncbi:hypothetical protein BKA58DRAFT_317819 [Alternaria rosae]|uniref:uncharacterized protein n=1 Tax=Alternaria rosae TaxID=1187941 RepID=UPI001E8D5039|nr:uncharacterized protein BKA58DRAFT_317819 [Alternaria rosae]KAH6868005.1 hypothetical protein BKA58DRAFT_317819 [Alternaria rosae]